VKPVRAGQVSADQVERRKCIASMWVRVGRAKRVANRRKNIATDAHGGGGTLLARDRERAGGAERRIEDLAFELLDKAGILQRPKVSSL
jgi:hypothetical protein